MARGKSTISPEQMKWDKALAKVKRLGYDLGFEHGQKVVTGTVMQKALPRVSGKLMAWNMPEAALKVSVT